MHTITMEFDKEFIDWWNTRWPQHIKEDQTMMIVASAAWEKAKEKFKAKKEN